MGSQRVNEEKVRDLIDRLHNFLTVEAVYQGGNRLVIKGRIPPGALFLESDIQHFFREEGFQCQVERRDDTIILAVDLDAQSSEKTERIPTLNIVLFIITFISATMVQAQSWSFEGVLAGLQFSVPLMAILLFHESGHYIASRIHKVKVSYPYFIPAPTIIGTLGAIIKSKSPFYNRRQLIDVGAAGPIAGFIVAIAVTIIGLSYSPVMPIGSDMVGITLGDSLIFNGLVALIVGNVPDGYELMLSPMAFAGWVGFFVTMLNLLPVGQLDGGHIAYALFGKRHRLLSKVIVFALLPLGFLWMGWFIWAFLLLFILKTAHPPTIDDSYHLDKRRRLVGYISLGIFILTFTPVPISI